MDILVISASPNKDGLTAACAAAAIEGARQAGGQAEEIRLNDLNVGMCEACDNGGRRIPVGPSHRALPPSGHAGPRTAHAPDGTPQSEAPRKRGQAGGLVSTVRELLSELRT
jgi:hypothetical protein